MIKPYIALLILWTSALFGDDCHPAYDPKQPQFIVGYGSLMNEDSKKRTDHNALESYPVIVQGYQRAFNIHSRLPGLNTTYLSATANEHASFNGVIYQLGKPQDILNYDTREKAYCRTIVHPKKLTPMNMILPEKKQIWIYVAKNNLSEPPSKQFPIVQSYVDLFIHGCIQIGEKYHLNDFAQNCINNTQFWSIHWINDRIYPRRPYIYEPYAAAIDHLLKENLPKQFSHIHFELSKD